MTDDASSTEENVSGCMVCLLRQLTSGVPRIWTPGTTGQRVEGTVLAFGRTKTPGNTEVLHVDIWTGGTERIRIIASGVMLAEQIRAARPQIGDRMKVVYNGIGILPPNRLAGRAKSQGYRDYGVDVYRGHHGGEAA